MQLTTIPSNITSTNSNAIFTSALLAQDAIDSQLDMISRNINSIKNIATSIQKELENQQTMLDSIDCSIDETSQSVSISQILKPTGGFFRRMSLVFKPKDKGQLNFERMPLKWYLEDKKMESNKEQIFQEAKEEEEEKQESKFERTKEAEPSLIPSNTSSSSEVIDGNFAWN